MTTYIAKLGCRWNSPTIGQIWGPLIKNPTQSLSQNSTSPQYLQYTLENSDETKWFNFHPNDILQCVVYDLSSDSSLGAPTNWELGVSFTSIPTKENAGVTTSYSPTNYVDTLIGFSSQTSNYPYYIDYQHSTSTDPPDFLWSTTPSYQSPWGACYGQSNVTLSFNFSTSCTCELSFRLNMTRSSGKQIYISDPEGRVTSGSTQG